MAVKPRIVVGPTEPRGSWLAGPARLAGVSLCLILAFAAGRLSSTLVPQEVSGRQAEIADLTAERDRLEQALATVRRGEQVTQEAYDMLRSEVAGLELELGEARADVAFYQRLLGAGGGQRGLAVHALRLRATASPQLYRFRLTLSQNLEQARVAAGAVTLTAEGVVGGRMVELGGTDLDLQFGAGGARFEFKYFQELDGSLRLPDGFDPERIIVTLDVAQRSEPVARGFDWQSLSKSGGYVSTAME